MIYRAHTLRLLALMATTGLPLVLLGQNAPAEEIVTLEKLEVSDIPIEQNIMPTSRPFNSVYGTDTNIKDIPRNVTIISREQLNAIAIRDVRDFSKLTSSSYTRTNFGAPGNPDIRGQYADIFVNGMRERITSNGNGMPIDFNSVESVNIVKGPATVIQGASNYVGGFADLITKRPYFDQPRGSAAFTVGSDEVYRLNIDYGAPVNDKFAVRFSYAGEDSEGFYDNEYRKTQSLYGAAIWRPTETYELFLNGNFSYMEYTENWGYNRPTQRLIDRGLYTTGVNANPVVPAVPGAEVSAGNNSQNALTVKGSANTIIFGPEVPIRERTRLLKPGDNSEARNFKLQAIQTITASPDLKVVNNNLFTYTQRGTFSSYYYNELIDPAITFESRVEFQRSYSGGQLNTGLAARYISVEAYNDFFFEPANVWDLSLSRSDVNILRSQYFLNSINGVTRARVPGNSSYIAAPTGDTNDSFAYSFSPFIQNQYELTDRLSISTGGRVDFLKVEAKEPIFFTDEFSASVALPNLNGSLIYKVTPNVTTYFTYNYSKNTAGAVANGGGFSPQTNSKDELTQPSTLYEVGAKWSLLEGKLFVGAAVFDQERYVKTVGNPAYLYKYQGFEIEANYQPNKNFYTTFGYAVIDGQAGNSGFEAIMLETSRLPGQVQASGAGPFNFAGVPNIRIQGLPKHQFNTLVAYRWDNGFGASINGTLHSEINNNWAGTIVIPWQYNIDASVFYGNGNWEARLTLLNLTDELNFAPPNGVYGNESILVEKGIRGEFTLTYKF